MGDVDRPGDGCPFLLFDPNANISRIIYSLHLELEPKGDDISIELIVPLDPEGPARHTHPLPPKTRAIDVRAGDYVRHLSGRYKVRAIRAYSATRPSGPRR